MAQTFGRDVTAALGVQADFATPAVADSYTAIPFYTHALNRNQKFEDDPVLGEGRGRSPAAPTDGLIDHNGDMVVPLDLGNAGLYLRGLMGLPTTTGADPDFTHTFKSGAASIPVHTLEFRHKADDFAQHVGLMVDKLAMGMQREGGYRRMTVSFKGANENPLTVSGAGDIADAITASKIVAVTGSLKMDDAVVAEIVSANWSMMNNLTPFDTPGLATVAGFDLGDFGFTGDITARFTSNTLYNKANAGTPFALSLNYVLSGSKSLIIRSGVTRLEKSGKPVTGPLGMQQQYNFRAEYDAAEADKAMVVATLKNQQASYAYWVAE